MVDCDCGHSFEDHHHPEGGLQCCKKCDCESAGFTTYAKIEIIGSKRGVP